MVFSELSDWLSHLETLHPKTIDLCLDRVQQVAQQLQLLPFPIPVITVGGTNGKGSCVALLNQILIGAGAKVGVYTSPHLLTYNERIVINGQVVTDQQLCEVFSVIEHARGSITLTYFEFGTLAALLLFLQAGVDVAILEVGLGGRLDAVNIVDADLAILTTIALDHTEWLGADREAIGHEKAGIFRSMQLAICGDTNPPASVIQFAKKITAHLQCLNQDFYFQVNSATSSAAVATWQWWNQQMRYELLPIPRIPLQNAATALAAITQLPERILKILPRPITETLIRRALQQVTVRGRFQVFDGPISIVLDVAHNPAAGKYLAQQLNDRINANRTIAVVGMLADKDICGTLEPFISIVDNWHIAPLAAARSAWPEQLADILKQLNAINVSAYPNIADAYKSALANAQVGDRIVVFGSFYTVAEVLQLIGE